MSQPPTTQGTEQFMLFDLGETITPPAPLSAPSEAKPAAARGSKRSQRSANTSAAQPAPAAPTRLKIAPASPLPEPSPVQLAAVRVALCQALIEQAQAAHEQLMAGLAAGERDAPARGITPERIAEAARLLGDAPAFKAAVSLLVLGAPQEPIEKAPPTTEPLL